MGPGTVRAASSAGAFNGTKIDPFGRRAHGRHTEIEFVVDRLRFQPFPTVFAGSPRKPGLGRVVGFIAAITMTAFAIDRFATRFETAEPLPKCI